MLHINLPSFPILATERLILREHEASDAPSLFALRTDESVMRYIDRERPKAIAETQSKITLMKEGFQSQTMLVWVVSLKEDPSKMIGEIGYYLTDFANYRAEIGYMLLPQYWRRGFIAEAIQQVIHFGFETLGLHSIAANINPGNDASRQLLLKQGFVKEAYFKEDYYFNGKFMDSEIYGMINPKH